MFSMDGIGSEEEFIVSYRKDLCRAIAEVIEEHCGEISYQPAQVAGIFGIGKAVLHLIKSWEVGDDIPAKESNLKSIRDSINKALDMLRGNPLELEDQAKLRSVLQNVSQLMV